MRTEHYFFFFMYLELNLNLGLLLSTVKEFPYAPGSIVLAVLRRRF